MRRAVRIKPRAAAQQYRAGVLRPPRAAGLLARRTQCDEAAARQQLNEVILQLIDARMLYIRPEPGPMPWPLENIKPSPRAAWLDRVFKRIERFFPGKPPS